MRSADYAEHLLDIARELKQGFDDGLFSEGDRTLADISSFVTTGRGGTPLVPGGFMAEVPVVGSR